ncbi:hypothetical protein KBZ17_11625 [Cyanobium sp. A2C-AMD]|nr:hypothetical protein [Cyanobium sp. A2C-AMD]
MQTLRSIAELMGDAANAMDGEGPPLATRWSAALLRPSFGFHNAAHDDLMDAFLQGVIWLQDQHWRGSGSTAGNYARRTGHPKEDLEQLAAIELIKASCSHDCKWVNRSSSNFIAYARPFVNSEITH